MHPITKDRKHGQMNVFGEEFAGTQGTFPPLGRCKCGLLPSRGSREFKPLVCGHIAPALTTRSIGGERRKLKNVSPVIAIADECKHHRSESVRQPFARL